MEFPLGILGVTLGTVILPRLSKEHAHRSPEQFRRTIDWALRLVCLVGIPAAIGLIVLAAPMLSTLFEYGKFTAQDTLMASYSLIAYSIGLPAFILIKVFTPAFFSRQDMRTPVRIGIIALISNMAYNLILVLPMVWFGFTAPHTALAIATSMSAWQQAWMQHMQKTGAAVAADGHRYLCAELRRLACAWRSRTGHEITRYNRRWRCFLRYLPVFCGHSAKACGKSVTR